MLRLSLGPLELFLKKGDATGEIWKKLKTETEVFNKGNFIKQRNNRKL